MVVGVRTGWGNTEGGIGFAMGDSRGLDRGGGGERWGRSKGGRVGCCQMGCVGRDVARMGKAGEEGRGGAGGGEIFPIEGVPEGCQGDWERHRG